MKKKMSINVGIIESLHEFIEVEKISIEHANNYTEHKVLKRSRWMHATKDEHKNRVMRECAFKAQAKSTIDIGVVTLKKTLIMENQSMLGFLQFLKNKWQILKLKNIRSYGIKKNLKNSNIFLMFISYCNKNTFKIISCEKPNFLVNNGPLYSNLKLILWVF